MAAHCRQLNAAWVSGIMAVRHHQLKQQTNDSTTCFRWTMGKYGMITAVIYCIGRAIEAGFSWILIAPDAYAGFNFLHNFNGVVLAIGTICVMRAFYWTPKSV